MKPKTLVILAALFLALSVSRGFAQTPKTKLRQKAAPAPQKTALAPVKIGVKWGYIDKTGTMVIPPQFSGAIPFSDGLALVKVGDKWGYIDKAGRMVIAPQFVDFDEPEFGLLIPGAGPFSEELAAARIGSKYGYIDKTGKVIIQPQFSTAWSFSEGLAAVEVGDKYGHIDKTGTMVIAPQFSDAESFSEGLAWVKLADEYGYIDKTGKMVIQPQFSGAQPFSEGLAAVKLDDRYGYIDKTGKMFIQPQFRSAGQFSEGLAAVEVGGKWGYIDKTGTMVIPPQFSSFLGQQFSEGLISVMVGGKCGYIDKTGKMVIAPQFDDASSFSVADEPDVTASLAAPPAAQVDVHFDAFNALHSPQGIGGQALASYLATLGITLTMSTPPGSVAVFDDRDIYDGKAVQASYGHNVLLQSGGGPVWYELKFSPPLQFLLFKRAALIAGPSGVTHPPWKASAYNAAGRLVATAQEDEIRSMTDVPLRLFALYGPGITRLRFEADNHHFDGFANLVLDQLVLKPQ